MISTLFVFGPIVKVLNPALYLIGHTAFTAAISGALS